MVNKAETSLEGRAISECPQVGILSPLVWNVVVNELLGEMEEYGCRILGYADELMIIFLEIDPVRNRPEHP